MSATVRALTILVLAVLTVSALAQRPPRRHDNDRLLDNVLKRNKELKCSGYRIVVFRSKDEDGKPTRRSRRESIVRDGRKSYTAYFDSGAMNDQIAVDDGKFRLHYYPETNVIHQSPSLINQNSTRLDWLMRDNREDLKIGVKEGGKVAGYDTILIEITHPRGPVQKIWVEKERSAILKRDTGTNSEGRSMYYEFKRFKYLTVIDPKEFTIDKPDAKLLTPEDRHKMYAKKMGFKMFKLRSNGKFALHGARISEREDRKSLVVLYGDGRVFVSLIQYKGKFDPDRFSQGRERRRFQAHAWQKDGYNFALLGDLPLPELKRLSKLVRQ